MKRKLNESDIPEEVSEQNGSSDKPSFEHMGLDPRLLQAIVKEKFGTPTSVQAKAIPLALEGRDILARSKTGSGKTAAYVLPILQAILRRKTDANKPRSTAALILVPTRELASQVTKVVSTFAAFCANHIQTVNLTPQIHDQAQRALLASTPDIVVATPARALLHLNSSALVVDKLTHLVIDEADLVLSYGYDEDFKNIVNLIPQGVQTFLASATLSTEVDTLKGLFCRDPAIVDLQDQEKKSNTINQYVVKCAEDEKFLLTFAMFKLKLIKGKCIVFVADVDRCYRVKLFLEQFGIKSCVLNSELPINCRIHVVEEFNKDVYDIIIATDEHEIGSPGETMADKVEKSTEQEESQTKEEARPPNTTAESKKQLPVNKSSAKKKRKHQKDSEYSISRGIDFHNVTLILNFDLPHTAAAYTHRIGRTARAQHTGTALSLCIPSSQYRKLPPLSHPSNATDEQSLSIISASQSSLGRSLKPYAFDMKKLEGFRYRVASALKVVTPGAVREARLRELREEMLKSERLKRHLEENPEDLAWLQQRRNDEGLLGKRGRGLAHLKHVPAYLMEGVTGGAKKDGGVDVGFVGFAKDDKNRNRIREARARNKFKRGRARQGGKADPLKTFNARGRKAT